VVLGVDTHLDFHVALDELLGMRLGELTVPTTTKGYESLIPWAERFAAVRIAGLEGAGSYGAGLAQHLRAKCVEVLEVERPKKRHLRRKGKSDPIDAKAAARAGTRAGSTPPAYCTSRGHGARRPQRLVRVAAGFGRGTVFLGLGMIAGEF
jgi:transposase